MLLFQPRTHPKNRTFLISQGQTHPGEPPTPEKEASFLLFQGSVLLCGTRVEGEVGTADRSDALSQRKEVRSFLQMER